MTKVGTNKKKSLSGVVLIMVVTVMFVLIIMLLATLSVVTTAQNKTYAKFEENQAYYSARSALDVYMSNMVSDEVYYAVDENGTPLTHLGPDGSTNVEKYTQSLAMELDFYRIKAHADTYENYLKMTDSEKENFSNDYWVNPDGVFTDEPYKSDYDDPREPFIEYEVVFPNIENDRKQGKFSDPGTKSTIRVEVLARTLNGHDAAASSADDMKNIAESSRSKDKITIKVTSTTTFQGYTGTAIGIYSTVDNPSYFQDALAAFGTGATTNNTSVIGGISTKSALELRNDGVLYGGLYSQTSTTYNTHQQTFIDAKDAVYINDPTFSDQVSILPFGYKYVENPSGGDNYDEIPIVFLDSNGTVDNTVTLSRGATFGYSKPERQDEKVQVVVNGNFNVETNETVNINGDLIVIGDLRIRCILNVTGSVIVTGNFVIDPGPYKQMNNYSAGSVGDYIYIGGDFISTGFDNIACKNNTAFEDKVMGTALSQRVYDVMVDGGIITKYDALAAGEFGGVSMDDIEEAINPGGVDSCYDADNDNVRISGIDLVRGRGGNIAVRGPRVIPTDTTSYDLYYHHGDREGEIISAREWAGTPNIKDREAENYTEIDFSDLSGATTIGNNDSISVSGKEKFVLSGWYNNSDITITGTGTADIYVDNANVYFMNGFQLTVGSETGSPKVNIYLSEGFDKSINKARIWSYDIRSKFENGEELKFGNGGNIKSPKIKIYMDPNTKLGLDNESIIAGYIYGPVDTVVANNNKGVRSTGKIWYNGYECIRDGETNNICSSKDIVVIGSVVCETFTAVNDCLYCYVPDSEDKEPGLPQLEWTPEQYRAS
ncbi:MAG: hypothetical protein ACI4YB_07815 [Oscillospiraceae bacterium]